MERNNNNVMKYILVFLGILGFIMAGNFFMSGLMSGKTYNYSEIVDNFKNHRVVKYDMDLNSGRMQITLNNGEEISYTAPSVALMYEDIKGYIKEYNNENPDNQMVYNLTKSTDTSWILDMLGNMVITILIMGFLGWLFLRKISSIGDGGHQMGFARARIIKKGKDSRVAKFSDVAGVDEAKEELSEVVDFLKNPESYVKMGARIPRGVLLVGPPGTGKTLLARAVAGEADVPFLSMSGSDFEEMFVGVGASRVRDLFEQAKKNSPCVIFIDEIDAVGRRRGSDTGVSRHEQTLNQLLVEMDGFGANEGVIVIAATNRVDILDPALTRPGRFDRQVVVGYPDMKGREEILKVHSRGKPFASDVKLKTVARSTTGFTGADLENLLNESALLAVRRGLDKITMKEIEESTIKVVVGSERRSKIVSEKDKINTAYHEGGHAVVTYFCETQDKVHEISIIPRGTAGGYTLSLPEKDESYVFKKKMLEDIEVLLGGTIAERLVLEDISTGASSDISRATKIAHSMVKKYGMSETMGPIVYDDEYDETMYGLAGAKKYSENTAFRIDEEIKRIVMECYAKAEKILKDNIESLHNVAKALVEKEKLNGEEFENVMKGNAIF